jgi:hypothetical protein
MVTVALTKQSGHLREQGPLSNPRYPLSGRGLPMKVRHVKALDNSAPNDGLSGWKRIVASTVVGAAAITTLMITGSMEHTTAVAVLVLLPLGVTLRD